VKTALREDLYYKVLSELTGYALSNDEELIALVRKLSQDSKRYEKVAAALEQVEKRGYGIVMPESTDLRLEEPEIVRQPGGQCGTAQPGRVPEHPEQTVRRPERARG
jgi:stage IV sporulation protein A